MSQPLVPQVFPPGDQLASTARAILLDALVAIRARQLDAIDNAGDPNAEASPVPTLSLAEDRALRVCVATIRALAEDHAAKNPAPILQLGNVSTEDLRQLLLESPDVRS